MWPKTSPNVTNFEDLILKINILLASHKNFDHRNSFLDIPRVPSLDKRELFDAIFDITAYRPPSSIMLPKSYKPPDLAISKLYWKGWLLLLVLAAFNPKTIGKALISFFLYAFSSILISLYFLLYLLMLSFLIQCVYLFSFLLSGPVFIILRLFHV